LCEVKSSMLKPVVCRMFAQNCRNIVALNLSGCTRITDLYVDLHVIFTSSVFDGVVIITVNDKIDILKLSLLKLESLFTLILLVSLKVLVLSMFAEIMCENQST